MLNKISQDISQHWVLTLIYTSRSDTTAGEQAGNGWENYVQLRTAAVHQPCYHTVSWQPGCSQTEPGDYCTEESTGFIAGWGMLPCLGVTKLFLDCYWSSTHPKNCQMVNELIVKILTLNLLLMTSMFVEWFSTEFTHYKQVLNWLSC